METKIQKVDVGGEDAEEVMITHKGVDIFVKEDNDGLGLIIDAYNNKTESHIDSMTIWYDDLTELKGGDKK